VGLCSAFIVGSHSRRSGMDHSFTCKLHHTCLDTVSIHQMVPLLVVVIAAYYSFIDPERMKHQHYG